MEKDKIPSRLFALDGLRGLAILFVFLSHAHISFIPVNSLTKFITSSGFVGVSFLFILSGFLMASLYPNPSTKLGFLQKRYTRIFPLFLSLCIARIITWFSNINQWYLEILVLIIVAISVNFIWVKIIRVYLNQKQRFFLFIGFLLLQLLIAIFYFLIVLRPPSFFFNEIPNALRLIIIFLVNSTLTFPISSYAFVMEAVLWSLAAEILFYIIYPFIFVPLIGELDSRSNFQRCIFILSLFPLFVGLFIMSEKVGHLSILSVYFFVYFVTGVSLGYIYRKNFENISKFVDKIKGIIYLSPFAFYFLIILILFFTTNPSNSNIVSFIWVIFAIPLTFLVAIIINKKTYLSRMLSSKVLVFVGTISYSMYLTHMFVIRTIDSLIPAKNVNLQYVQFFLSLTFSILFAGLLYLLLERPYFNRPKNNDSKMINLPYQKMKHLKFLLLSLILIFVTSLFVVFQSDFSIFSTEKRNFPTPTYSKNSLTFFIKASQNKFGVVEAMLKNQSIHKQSKITFRIKEKGASSWYSSSDFYLNNSDDPLPTEFGFPIINNSSGKSYEISFSATDGKLTILSEPVMTFYMVNKKDLIKNPFNLITFLISKVETVSSNKDAQLSLLLIIPFIITSIFLIIFHEQKRVGRLLIFHLA